MDDVLSSPMSEQEAQKAERAEPGIGQGPAVTLILGIRRAPEASEARGLSSPAPPAARAQLPAWCRAAGARAAARGCGRGAFVSGSRRRPARRDHAIGA